MADRPIVVLGSGVAGMATARRLLLAGQRPLLVAPGAPVESRGETLSPRALPLLSRLEWSGLLDADTALASAGRFSVWGDASLRRADMSEGVGNHIDRRAFEARMEASLVAAGLDHVREAATALEHDEKGVRVTLAGGTRIDAFAVVDCTGRAALSSGALAGRRRLDRMVAAWRVAPLTDDDDVLPATLVEAVSQGWFYTAPMPGRRMMLGLFSESDLLPAGLSRSSEIWRDLLTASAVTAARIDSLGLLDALAAEPPHMSPASSVVGSRLVEGHILRAGDAAAALDPLGANGLTTALWSGIAAAEAALALREGDGTRQRDYERRFLEGIAGSLAGQSALYAAEPRFPGSAFWSRRRRQPR